MMASSSERAPLVRGAGPGSISSGNTSTSGRAGLWSFMNASIISRSKRTLQHEVDRLAWNREDAGRDRWLDRFERWQHMTVAPVAALLIHIIHGSAAAPTGRYY